MPARDAAASRLPPLLMLRAFEATGRTGSMRKAADDLGVSHTVVSRHVRNLEGWMGRKLLTAGPRGVTLTAEGQILLASVSKAFRLIANTAGELRSTRNGAVLRIWCIPGLATRWLTPRLAIIEDILRGTDVVLRSTDAMPDFASGEADLAIGFGDFDSIATAGMPLLRPRMFPLASPQWLASHGAPASLADLPNRPLIHEESHRQWTDWFEAAGVGSGHPLHGPRLWDASLGLDAARSSQGIALGSRILAADDLASGRLVELFDTNIHLGGYYVVSAHQRHGNPAIDRLIAWLGAELNLAERDGQRQSDR
ncbi:MAG TPA: LysR substrate-binding domain-containing protein [Devosia sp.]|nr:LysR substrate-binding domain-containing protein [Devosia sp.]